MQITEPMTMATDYLLAGLGVWFGVRLLGRGRRLGDAATSLWGGAFLGMALAALAGGTVHGLALELGAQAHRLLWKIVHYAVGGASFCLVAAALLARIRGPLRGLLLALAAAQLAVYCWWMWTRDDFRFVIYGYGGAMLVVLALEGWGWIQVRAPSAPWIVGGVLVSFAAAAVQQYGPSLHTHFNHNDLYHVIQMAGLWLLYRGGLLLQPFEREPGAG